MSVTFRDGMIWLSDICPNADEIYGVVFEGCTNVQGIATSREDFESTGLRFVSYTLVPILVLSRAEDQVSPLVNWVIAGKEGNEEAVAASHSGIYLGYAIIKGAWLSFAPGAVEEACAALLRLGVAFKVQLTLKQYFAVTRLRSEYFQVRDDTGNSLTAPILAENLPTTVPEGFHGTLYPYQLHGFAWLTFMYAQQLGGLLADEMGLGKSVQIVCLILEAKRRDGGMSLVIAPATLLENWRREFAKFGPLLKVQIHRGPRRAGIATAFEGFDVIITSYDTAVSDVSLLGSISWKVTVVDEAQGIKNPEAKRTISLKKMRGGFSVAVTGTPVENSLRDLWSLVDFALPSFLGTLSEFQNDHPDSQDGAVSVESRVSPLILRRRVADVATDLPERIDIPVVLEMDLRSAQAYEAIREKVVAEYGRVANLVAITSLRQFCAHPWAVNTLRGIADPLACSAKLKRTYEIMEEIVACGQKALIFAAYSEIIDLVLRVVSRGLGIPGWTLDGRTVVPERQKAVDTFSRTEGPAILVMNPRAAGVGLNITAANHVIHYTPEWNPALEDQASARAHRRGQTQVVRVYRLFYAGTVEEVMDARMESKRDLAEAAVVGTTGSRVDVDDLVRALSISPMKGTN